MRVKDKNPVQGKSGRLRGVSIKIRQGCKIIADKVKHDENISLDIVLITAS